MTAPRQWTVQEDAQMDALIRTGVPRQVIAGRLGRPTHALEKRVARRKTTVGRLRHGYVWPLAEVGRLLRVSWSAVRVWVRMGWLATEPGDTPIRLVTRESLHRFLERREAWPSYTPNQIRDLDMQAYARFERTRAGGRWVSARAYVRQVGGYDVKMAHRFAADGRIPAQRLAYGWFVWVTPDHVWRIGPPLPRPAVPWPQKEDPWTARALAQALGVNIETVWEWIRGGLIGVDRAAERGCGYVIPYRAVVCFLTTQALRASIDPSSDSPLREVWDAARGLLRARHLTMEEVGQLLGYTRSGMLRFARRAGDFPAPAIRYGERAGGDYYARGDIRAWLDAHPERWTDRARDEL